MDSARLGESARREIRSAELAYVSAASAWEVAIKAAIGKIELPGPFQEAVAESGFSELEISFAHAAAAGELPPHHSDPFDRMLVAQAKVEGLTVVTHDQRFQPYGAEVLWT